MTFTRNTRTSNDKNNKIQRQDVNTGLPAFGDLAAGKH
jgi:hypothetical protein